MHALADSYLVWVPLLWGLVVIYLLPTIIGAIRQVHGLSLVFLFNIIGAPTGIGWLAALILAFGPRRVPPTPGGWRPDSPHLTARDDWWPAVERRSVR